MGLMMVNVKHPKTGRCCQLHYNQKTGKWVTDDGIEVEQKDIRSVDDGADVGCLLLVVMIVMIVLMVKSLFF